MKKLKVTINTVGKTEIEAEGFAGTECTEASAGLVRKLGGDATVEEKPEMQIIEETTQELVNQLIKDKGLTVYSDPDKGNLFVANTGDGQSLTILEEIWI